MSTQTTDELLSWFTGEEGQLKDALNYARGHLLRRDIEAATNSMADAQVVVDRILDRLDEENDGRSMGNSILREDGTLESLTESPEE